MASISPSTGNIRLKPKKPLDVWSTREKLCLASAVFKIGDQNWVSVSRAIKPYAEPNRPPEWFHQKNCVLQYYDMLEQLEQPNRRKRGGDSKSETDTPSLQIMRKMTIERSEQLKKEIMEMQKQFKLLKSEVEEVKAGQWDDRIKEVWEEIQQEEVKAAKEQIKVEAADEEERTKMSVTAGAVSGMVEIDESTLDATGDNVDISVLTDEDGSHFNASTSFLTSTPTVTNASTSDLTKLATPSHLLSSLLKSEVTTATGLQQLKREQEQVQLDKSGQSLLTPLQRSLLKTPVTQDDPLTTPPSGSAPTLSRLLSPAKEQATSVTTSNRSPLTASSGGMETLIEEPVVDIQTDILTVCSSQAGIEENLVEDADFIPTPVEGVEEEVVEESIISKYDEDSQEPSQLKATPDTELSSIKDEPEKDSQDEEESVKKHGDLTSETEPTDSFVKDEPLSPTSSISSRISESGSKRGSRRGRIPASRISRLGMRKSYTTDDDKKDDGSSRHSDLELSEDEVRESDDLISGHMTSVNASSILSESFPNSPASLSMCSDTEEEKSFKQWKKSIMLVWRAAATHKYANVFLHPVTNDIAPGYRSVVLRPMDLSTIKKNVETSVIRTTGEFQRDMMLMFTNAIMYNSSDHNVYRMAVEMYDDVMKHLEQYVNTQIMMQSSDGKTLRQSRRPDASDKEDDAKKRRASVDQVETGGKTKKRKTRLDESLDRA